MKRIIYILAFTTAVMLLLPSCEKGYIGDGESTTPPTTESQPSDDEDEGPLIPVIDGNEEDSGSGSIKPFSTVTVSQFTSGISFQVYLEAYIVGDVTKSMAYANLTPPFSQPQAILLADSPDETDTNRMIPVRLVSGSKYRSALNLQDNPTNYKRKVRLCAQPATYLNRTGIKDIQSFELL